MVPNFNQRLRAGELLSGTMITLRDPTVSDVLAGVGFDWFFVDGEHGPIETSDLLAQFQAVANRAAMLVRVPAIDEVPIKKALDLGAQGIIVPQVNTAEEVERVVQYSRYPPLGGRGVGLGRAHGYGATFDEYMNSANEEVCVVIQAEHKRAVQNIESIVQVKGFDAVLVGPYDLSASMGLMGQVGHPDVVAAIDRVAEVCRSASIPLGIFGATAESVRPYIEKGFNLIVAGVDSLMLSSAAGELLKQLRPSR